MYSRRCDQTERSASNVVKIEIVNCDEQLIESGWPEGFARIEKLFYFNEMVTREKDRKTERQIETEGIFRTNK